MKTIIHYLKVKEEIEIKNGKNIKLFHLFV